MCRNIKRLRYPDHVASHEELKAAALQYVRKVSGYPKPSLANTAAFETAIEEIAAATQKLLDSLVQRGAPS